MKKKLIASLIVLASFCVSGCSVNQAILADSLTTGVAIGSGIGQEANPILPKSALGASVASAALKVGMLQVAKHYFPSLCPPFARSVYSSSLGAAANNTMVYSGHKDSYSMVFGVGVGVFSFAKNSKNAANRYCDRG